MLAAARQVAAAIGHLHSHDIIHGDLSLCNVLLADPPPGSDSVINCKVIECSAACMGS